MKRTYSLSFVLDKKGEISEDLVISNSLENLDTYIRKNFKDTLDVRKKYDYLISEFCLTYMDKIMKENKANHNNRTGSIVILERVYDDNRKLINTIPISVIYQGEHLLKRTKALTKIKEQLNIDDNLKRLFNEKKHLLSQNDKDLIKIYFSCGRPSYKETAIWFIVSRIKVAAKDETYYYLRHLTHLCNLKEKDKKKVHITEVNTDSIKDDLKLQTQNSFVMYEQMTMDIDKLFRKEGK